MEGWGLAEVFLQLPLHQPPLLLCWRSFSCVMGYNWQEHGVFGMNMAFLLFFFDLFHLFPISSPLSLSLQYLLLNIFIVCFILGAFMHLLGCIRPLVLWGGVKHCGGGH